MKQINNETTFDEVFQEGIIDDWEKDFAGFEDFIGSPKNYPGCLDLPDCPASEAYSNLPTVEDSKPVPIYETGEPVEGFYLGVLPDGGRVLAA